jgi:hypothetical protein
VSTDPLVQSACPGAEIQVAASSASITALSARNLHVVFLVNGIEGLVGTPPDRSITVAAPSLCYGVIAALRVCVAATRRGVMEVPGNLRNSFPS